MAVMEAVVSVTMSHPNIVKVTHLSQGRAAWGRARAVPCAAADRARRALCACNTCACL
jgi:hypothetical protein